MANEILLVNPRRRRRKTAAVKRRAVRRRAPRRIAATRVRRKVRRNPIRRIAGNQLGAQLQTALGGALGGLGLSLALGTLPLPATWKAGPVGYATKGVLAIGIGMLARNFGLARPATAARLTEGALTVVAYEALRDGVARFMPNLPLGMYMSDPALGYYGSGWNPAADDGLGMYLPNFSSVPDASVFDGVSGYEGEYAGY